MNHRTGTLKIDVKGHFSTWPKGTRVKVFIQPCGQTADIERLERLDGSFTLTNNMGGVPLEQIELDVQITGNYDT